jgi:hypothetical protein
MGVLEALKESRRRPYHDTDGVLNPEFQEHSSIMSGRVSVGGGWEGVSVM